MHMFVDSFLFQNDSTSIQKSKHLVETFLYKVLHFFRLIIHKIMHTLSTEQKVTVTTMVGTNPHLHPYVKTECQYLLLLLFD